MKKITLLTLIIFSIVFVSCSKSDDPHISYYDGNIIGLWQLESAFIKATAGEVPLTISYHSQDTIGCLTKSVLDIKSNKTAKYHHFLYSLDTGKCVSNNESYQNMKWELLNSQKIKLTYEYLNERYSHLFDFVVNDDVLTMDIENALETIWRKQ